MSEQRPRRDEIAPLERLLELAGPRPGVGAAELEPLRPGAMAALREGLRRRRRRRLGWTLGLAAAAAVAVAAGLVALGPRLTTPVAVARLERLAGKAAVIDGEPAAPGADVLAAGWLETGAGSRAAVVTKAGHRLRLDEASRLRLVAPARLELAAGAVYVETSGGGLELVTPRGTVRDVGTRFEVRLGGGELRVRVRDGRVALARAGETVEAAAGRELRAGAGPIGEGEAPIDGEAWAWIGAVARPLTIEGRRLREVLDEVAREHGWRIVVAPGVDPAALDTRLHGDVAGLSPEATVAAAVAGSGLASRLARGVLTVVPAAQ